MSLIVLHWLIIMLVWSIEGCFWSFCGGLVWRCGRWGVDGVRFFFLEICLGGWFADSFFFFCYRFLSIVERAVRLWAISLFPSALSPLHPFLPFFLRLSLFYCFFFFPLQHNATLSVEMISKQTPRPFLYPYPYPSYHLCIPLSSTLIGVLTDDPDCTGWYFSMSVCVSVEGLKLLEVALCSCVSIILCFLFFLLWRGVARLVS